MWSTEARDGRAALRRTASLVPATNRASGRAMLRRLLPSLLDSSPPLRPLAHRAIAKRDVEHSRWAVDGKFVMPKDNIGVRVEPDFVTEAEAAAIGAEILAAGDAYGYPYDGDTRTHLLDDKGKVAKTEHRVNNIRVTGRSEKPDVQKIPPWNYGDEFDTASLSPALAQLAEKIATCGHFAVGPARDATINIRENSFFQLDPHVDPADDGPDVFILGLESSVVLTFTPPEDLLPVPRRRDPREVGLRSWSDRDIDVLVRPRTLVHFTGLARSTWMHAIRAGVEVDAADGPATCDWWGQPDYLLRRSPRRLSIVLAFGEPVK